MKDISRKTRFQKYSSGKLVRSKALQMGTNRGVQSDIVLRERGGGERGNLRTYSFKWGVSIKLFPLSELMELHGRRGRKSLRARGNRGHQENTGL